MARRTSGEGSITKRSNGLWQAALQIDGKRKTVYGKTQREVKAKLDALKQEVGVTSSGAFPEAHTLGDLMAIWLETGATHWAPRTLSDHKRYSRTILEALGEKTPLSKI